MMSLVGENAAADISKHKGEAVFFRCDVTSNSDCQRTVNDIYDKFGRIDILFNNAEVIRKKI